MKIAIFFLLVGLSSCLVTESGLGSTGGLQSCHGKIKLPEAQIMSTLIIMMARKHELMKQNSMGNSGEKTCLLEMAFSVLKLGASCMKCDISNIAQVTLNFMKVDSQSKEILQKAILMDDPKVARDINIDMGELVVAVCFTAKKLTYEKGIDLDTLLKEVLLELVSLIGPALEGVTSLLNKVTGSIVGVVSTVTGVADALGNLAGGVVSTVTDATHGLLDVDKSTGGHGGGISGILGGLTGSVQSHGGKGGFTSGLTGTESNDGRGGFSNGPTGGVESHSGHSGFASGLTGGTTGSFGGVQSNGGEGGFNSGLTGGLGGTKSNDRRGGFSNGLTGSTEGGKSNSGEGGFTSGITGVEHGKFSGSGSSSKSDSGLTGVGISDGGLRCPYY